MSRIKIDGEHSSKQYNRIAARDNGWGGLIRKAELHIKTAKQEIISLKKSILFFQKRRIEGRAFQL